MMQACARKFTKIPWHLIGLGKQLLVTNLENGTQDTKDMVERIGIMILMSLFILYSMPLRRLGRSRNVGPYMTSL